MAAVHLRGRRECHGRATLYENYRGVGALPGRGKDVNEPRGDDCCDQCAEVLYGFRCFTHLLLGATSRGAPPAQRCLLHVDVMRQGAAPRGAERALPRTQATFTVRSTTGQGPMWLCDRRRHHNRRHRHHRRHHHHRRSHQHRRSYHLCHHCQ